MKQEKDGWRPRGTILYTITTSADKLIGDKAWAEKINIYRNETADFSFIGNIPFCGDGNRGEMEKQLRERGWETVGGIISKKSVSLGNLLKCMAYARSYKRVYESEVNDPLEDIPFTISGFLGLVDLQAKNELKRIKSTYKQKLAEGVKGIIDIIKQEGFAEIEYNMQPDLVAAIEERKRESCLPN